MIRALRLARPRDFRRVYGTRRMRHGGLLTVHVAANDLGRPRVGFSVSAKVGGAVRRNLVRRRLRSVAAGILKGRNDAVDLVIVVRPAAAPATFAQLEAELGRLLAQVLPL